MRRKGKCRISHLPDSVRTQINEQIHDGCSFLTVTNWKVWKVFFWG
jgi:hypothetical protein